MLFYIFFQTILWYYKTVCRNISQKLQKITKVVYFKPLLGEFIGNCAWKTLYLFPSMDLHLCEFWIQSCFFLPIIQYTMNHSSFQIDCLHHPKRVLRIKRLSNKQTKLCLKVHKFMSTIHHAYCKLKGKSTLILLNFHKEMRIWWTIS